MRALIKESLLTIERQSILTQGSVGLCMELSFTEDWDGLDVTAVFAAGGQTLDVAVSGGEITIPWELLSEAGHPLTLSFHGALPGGGVVRRTNIASLGPVCESRSPAGASSGSFTPTLADQIRAIAQQALSTAQSVRADADGGAFDGAAGPQGEKGDKGDAGATGAQGPAGQGVPAGGTAGQVLTKASGGDYDAEWAAPSGGTGDYGDLTNKPSVNNVSLSGNRSLSELGITSPEPEIFRATYGTTTSAELEAAYQAGKLVLCSRSGDIYVMTERASATYHKFSVLLGYMRYGLSCVSNAWSTNSATYADANSVPTAAAADPADLGTAAKGSSANYARADHVHRMPSASDVGAIAAPSSPSAGDFLVYTSNGWSAQSLSTWSGGSY